MTEQLDNESRIELVIYRLRRAEATLAEADCLADNGMFSGAMNRLYYACYYAVSSLLIAREQQASTHAGVRRMFGMKFIKTGIIPLNHGKFFNEIFELRHSNDYDDFIFCDEDTYREFRPKAIELIEAVKAIIL